MKSENRYSSSIVFMLTSLDHGGAETQVVALAEMLKSRGWSVSLISMLPPRAFTERLASHGIEVATLGMRRGVPDPTALIRLISLLRHWKPAVFHCHMVHANLLGRIARAFTSIPVMISSAHSINEGGRMREIAYRLTDNLADLTTNVSLAAVAHYVEVGAVPESRIRPMVNGIDTTRFMASSKIRERIRKNLACDSQFVWMAVGRIEEPKDYPNLLQAFSIIVRDHPARLVVVGTGALRESIEAHINTLALQESVMLLGDRDDVPELLNAADSYVMSSAWEGLPMALLEAAATELPIVCTDVGGNREVVIEGVTGLVVPPKDPVQLSRAMIEMMSFSPPQRMEMGTRARQHVEDNFSLIRVVDHWEKLYGELLSQSVQPLL